MFSVHLLPEIKIPPEKKISYFTFIPSLTHRVHVERFCWLSLISHAPSQFSSSSSSQTKLYIISHTVVRFCCRKIPSLLSSTSIFYPPMTRNASFESPPATRKSPREKGRVGEVAGGTAADCAAVCCCCPCGVMNLLILTVYKVPKGLCRKAWAHTKKERRCVAQKNGLLKPRPNGFAGGVLRRDDVDVKRDADDDSDEKKSDAESERSDVLEKEMWARFYGAGFLRSASQREL